MKWQEFTDRLLYVIVPIIAIIAALLLPVFVHLTSPSGGKP